MKVSNSLAHLIAILLTQRRVRAAQVNLGQKGMANDGGQKDEGGF